MRLRAFLLECHVRQQFRIYLHWQFLWHQSVVTAPGCHLQGVIHLIPTGTAEPYLSILGELNLNADESVRLVSGQSGLLPLTVCSHIVFES